MSFTKFWVDCASEPEHSSPLPMLAIAWRTHDTRQAARPPVKCTVVYRVVPPYPETRFRLACA